jgi:tRNA-intron endonuclease
MDATYDGDLVRAGRQAREQFYDARGYGRPDDGGVALAPVEAAHLLFRGDLDAVVDGREGGGDRLDCRAFLASTAVSEVAFFVYKDLRDRGFYLSPTLDSRVGDDTGDFVVYPRGQGPWDDAVAYRVRAVSERAEVTAAELQALATADGDGTGVLAVVDEESELTYLELSAPTLTGSSYHDLDAVTGDLLADRVLVWDPPMTLHERAFYGQRLDENGGPVQLSLVEAAYLASRETLSVTDEDGGAGESTDTAAEAEQAVVERGRAVEGERFDRRLRVYSALRTAGVVPKTGFKFGADFRTYADVDSVDDLGHSEMLVRVLPPTYAFAPRDLALDVRLAHGVRKRMVFALTGANEGIDWLSVSRLTP